MTAVTGIAAGTVLLAAAIFSLVNTVLRPTGPA